MCVAVSIIIFELQASVSLELAMPTPRHCLAIAVPPLYCFYSILEKIYSYVAREKWVYPMRKETFFV